MKPRIFLNSTDVAEMTGYSLRNARNILNWVRTEYGLPDKWQVVSIFKFCACFDLPVIIIYDYINNSDFKLTPLDVKELQKMQSSQRSGLGGTVDFSVFEGIINTPREKK